MLKVHGLLQPDGATTVILNAEEMTVRKALSVVVNAIPGERRQTECLDIFRAFLDGESYELPITIEAIPALTAGTIDGKSALADVTDNRALSAPRDQPCPAVTAIADW